MSPVPYTHIRRRNKLVIPRLQLQAALGIGVGISVCVAIVALLLYRDIGQALRDLSFSGHFQVKTPFHAVDTILVRYLAALFALVVAVSSLLFLYYVHRIRKGVARVVETLRLSGEGDLSTPADPRGLREISDFAKEVDQMRFRTLALIGELRAEAEALRSTALPQKEFFDRWEALKGSIGRIAP